jgi:hypothetical protein
MIAHISAAKLEVTAEELPVRHSDSMAPLFSATDFSWSSVNPAPGVMVLLWEIAVTPKLALFADVAMGTLALALFPVANGD